MDAVYPRNLESFARCFTILLAQTLVEGISDYDLRDDLRTTYAVTRCLEIISEATSWLAGTEPGSLSTSLV